MRESKAIWLWVCVWLTGKALTKGHPTVDLNCLTSSQCKVSTRSTALYSLFVIRAARSIHRGGGVSSTGSHLSVTEFGQTKQPPRYFKVILVSEISWSDVIERSGERERRPF